MQRRGYFLLRAIDKGWDPEWFHISCHSSGWSRWTLSSWPGICGSTTEDVALKMKRPGAGLLTLLWAVSWRVASWCLMLHYLLCKQRRRKSIPLCMSKKSWQMCAVLSYHRSLKYFISSHLLFFLFLFLFLFFLLLFLFLFLNSR